MVAINGFTVGERNAIGIISAKVPDTAVTLAVRGEVAPLLLGAARDFHAQVEPLIPGTCWGYALRAVRGSTVPSFHGAGIAVDFNAPAHPLGKRGTFNPAQKATCQAIARKYGLRWGGDYVNRADEMHFEIIVPRARALELVAKLQTPPPGPPPPDDWRTHPILRLNAKGPHVRHLQELLIAKRHDLGQEGGVDGFFGPGLQRELIAFQEARGLRGDGECGPLTWERLH